MIKSGIYGIAHFVTFFLEILENLDEKKSASWGKMTPQRMIEHLSDCIYMSCGIGNHELLIPEEKIKGMQAFLISDKEMPQNIFQFGVQFFMPLFQRT